MVAEDREQDDMTTVPELFARFFAYVLLLDQEYTSGHPQRSYEQVRHDLTALLEEQETAARHQGMSAQEYQAARFVVISWADEILLQQTAWEHHQRWQACPLQAEYYGTQQAGAEPGEDLQRLITERPEVREVYRLCLGLGFSGRRHSGLSDRLLLTNIQDQPSSQAQQTQDAPLLLDDVWTFNFKLTPQPYEVHRPARQHVRQMLTFAVSQPARRYVRQMLTFAIPLLVVLCLGLWLAQWEAPLTQQEAPLAQQEAPLARREEAPLPCLSPSMSGPAIEQMLAAQPCAQVSVAVQACTVTLSGRVESEDQRARIHRIVQSIASSVRIDDTLRIIPRPFCEVLALLEPMQTHAETRTFGLVARPNKSGAPPVYVQGEDLVIEVTMPAQFKSYIYVDFYDNDGRVHYLFFNPEFNRPFTPQSVHTLGYIDGQPAWGIGPPYGRGLVTVIASKTPLVFPPLEPGDDAESAALYLSRLRQALPQEGRQAEVAATFFFIETRAQ
jgi:type IV/VI secretion system ImpK/VasF family protein